MSVALRVASSHCDGAGHVMRCFALAEQIDASVRFYIDAGSPWLPRLAPHFDTVEETTEAGAERLIADAFQGRIRLVILDGYRFSPLLSDQLKEHCLVAEVRDGPSSTHADLVIAPGLDARPEDHPSASRVLAGPAYALLRMGFAERHDVALHSSRAAVRRLLVSFGAVDSRNATGATLEALRMMADPPAAVVVLGPDAPHRDSVRARAEGMSMVDFVVDPPDLAALLTTVDLAIGAGGVSLLERLCCGVPSLIISLSANQFANARTAHSLGVAHWLGCIQELDPTDIARAVEWMVNAPQLRSTMRNRGLGLVDGQGASRVAAALGHLSVSGTARA